ncbi:MAG: GHKL domain-containing protein [Lachnospiraceae bacterium]|nr:GHKL domain-containing protein [Lachnospiraceae bacterium]
MNVLRKYWSSVYHYILLVVPGCCTCAAIFATVFKILGNHPELSWFKVGLFDFTQLIYLGIALYFIYQNKLDSTYFMNHMLAVKAYITISLAFQYNFLLYFFPSEYVWGCTFLFFLIPVFFFDTIMTIIHVFLYLLSLGIATFRSPDAFLPMEHEHVEEALTFRIVVLVLGAFCTILIVYLIESFLLQFQIRSEENTDLLKKQLEHYQSADLLDMELRKFRHDIRNHFICMEYLVQNKDMENLETYFQDLKESFAFQERVYLSGNHIIDAILNHELSRHCSNTVNVIVYGSLKENCSLSSMDLCTVFSNILSNAIASVNKCDSSMKPELTIHFQTGSHYFSISVSNSICEEDAGNLMPKKKSSRNHGFGLNKIKEIVEKYNGNFEQTRKEQTVITKVYLPL